MQAAVAINNANTASEIHQKQMSSSFVQSAPFGTISALPKRFPLWVHFTYTSCLSYHRLTPTLPYPFHSSSITRGPQKVHFDLSKDQSALSEKPLATCSDILLFTRTLGFNIQPWMTGKMTTDAGNRVSRWMPLSFFFFFLAGQ